jgi:O-antigen/teichoic acid export membrane protein
VTLVGSIAVILLSRLIVADVLQIPPELQNDAITGLYLGCATILSIMLGQIFQLVLQGLQRFDRYLLLTNLSSVSFSIGSIVLVLNGFGVIGLLYWNLFTAIFVGVLSYFVAKKLLPEYRFTLKINSEAWRAVSRYAASIIAYQIFGNVLLLFERAWIVRKFGTEALTYYAIPMTLAMYLHLFTGSLVLAMFPMVNELLSEREKLVGGKLFLGLWLGVDFANVSYSLLIIHVATFAILAMSTIVWQVAESFRAAALNAFATFVWMAVAIPLMVGLSDEWQTSGVAVGRLAGVIVFVPLILYVESRFLGGILWRFWGQISVRIAFAGILAFVAEWLVISNLAKSWLTFAIAVLIGSLVYLGALLLTRFFDDSERLLFNQILAKYR